MSRNFASGDCSFERRCEKLHPAGPEALALAGCCASLESCSNGYEGRTQWAVQYIRQVVKIGTKVSAERAGVVEGRFPARKLNDCVDDCLPPIRTAAIKGRPFNARPVRDVLERAGINAAFCQQFQDSIIDPPSHVGGSASWTLLADWPLRDILIGQC